MDLGRMRAVLEEYALLRETRDATGLASIAALLRDFNELRARRWEHPLPPTDRPIEPVRRIHSASSVPMRGAGP